MEYLIIGDIHGCYYTFEKFLKEFREDETVILLGDYVHKGNHPFKTLRFLKELYSDPNFPIIMLKGNNEELYTRHYKMQDAFQAERKFRNHKLDFSETMDWLDRLPHQWENEDVFVSHAGISAYMPYPVENNSRELLFNRNPLRNIGKRQFLGHIVHKKPYLDPNANALYLDTGAGYGKKLSGARIDESGMILELMSLKVDKRDIKY